MDTLYYSNFCKHSQKVLQFLVKSNLTDRVNFVCIDKRTRDPNNNQMYVILENGQKVIMPPNISSVPALLLVKKNYSVILGENIIQHFHPQVREKSQASLSQASGGEPMGYHLMPSNQGLSIVSEQYTFYNLTPEELSAKGSGGRRPMHNYVSAKDEMSSFIPTPPDTYQPDKVSKGVTVDVLQQQRNSEIPMPNKPFI